MIRKNNIMAAFLLPLALLGGTASANEQLVQLFQSRLSELNYEITRIEGGAMAEGMGCHARLTILIDEFPTLFLQNYVCDADENGNAQIMARQQ